MQYNMASFSIYTIFYSLCQTVYIVCALSSVCVAFIWQQLGVCVSVSETFGYKINYSEMFRTFFVTRIYICKCEMTPQFPSLSPDGCGTLRFVCQTSEAYKCSAQQITNKLTE